MSNLSDHPEADKDKPAGGESSAGNRPGEHGQSGSRAQDHAATGSGPAPNPSPDAGPRQAAAAGAGREAESEPDALLSIDEFARVQLRVAVVLQVEPHPNADRLLKLQVDLGDERRQLVAGIAAHYKPEDLVGKRVVVVANLKPAKLRGEVSQGMILAASSGDVVSVLAPDKPLPPGSSIR